MKKNVLIFIVIILLFTGCNKNEMSKVNNDKINVQDNVVDDKVKGVTDNEEEVIDDSKTNEIIVEPKVEVTTTTTTTTTTKKVTTKKTTKKTTTSKVTTTIKSETTTTTKKVEEEIAFYIPVGGVTSYYIDSSNAKYPYSVFFNGSGNSIYSTAKGNIYIVSINNSCKLKEDKDNPDVVFADIVIYHKKNLYSVYRCVKSPVFSKTDIGKEVTENTVIGYIGKHANSVGDTVSAFGFSFQTRPSLNVYYTSLSNIVVEPSLYIIPFGYKRKGTTTNRKVY